MVKSSKTSVICAKKKSYYKKCQDLNVHNKAFILTKESFSNFNHGRRTTSL